MKPIFIISGEKGSGKTSFLIELIHLLQDEKYKVKGFVALHDLKEDAYYIKRVSNNEKDLLMKRVSHYRNRPHHFEVSDEAIKKGNNWMREIVEDSPDLAVIDEIGNFELNNQLWYEGFSSLIESPVPLIFTTKNRYVERIMNKWHVRPTFIFNSIQQRDTIVAVNIIVEQLKIYNK